MEVELPYWAQRLTSIDQGYKSDAKVDGSGGSSGGTCYRYELVGGGQVLAYQIAPESPSALRIYAHLLGF